MLNVGPPPSLSAPGESKCSGRELSKAFVSTVNVAVSHPITAKFDNSSNTPDAVFDIEDT